MKKLLQIQGRSHKQGWKRFFSALLLVSMLCTLVCGISVPVSAASGVKAKLDAFMKSYPSGNSWTSSFDGGVECYGFAKLAVYNVFGSYNSSRYRSWTYDGTSTSGMNVVGSITSYSATNVKNLLSNAKCGDVLQFNTPKQHSMIVYSVESDGVMIYDCNWVGYCKISLRKVDFGAWSGRNSTKLTLLRSNNYAAIGDDSPSVTPDTCTCSTSYAGTYTCTTSTYPLTIRSGHGTSYSAIGSIPAGATVKVTKANGSWAHVTYNGVSGYASMEYLTVPLQATSAYPVPFKCYPLSDAQHAANAYDAVNGNEIGYIYGDDYCTVKAVYDNGWCLVNCPWNGGTKDVYTWTAFFLNIKCSPYTEVVQAKADTYIRVGSSSTLGWVDKGDRVTIVDNTSARAQIIYPHSDGTYRCAWVNYDPAFTHNHTPGAAATCTTPQVCTTCDATIVNAKGHSAGAAATCTNPQTCTRCGIVINDAKGHSAGAAATCTSAQKCTVCGTTITPATGHSYTAGDYTDPAHPHKIYNTCSCGAQKDSGSTTKVSGCIECYPAPTISGITYSPANVKTGDTVTFTLNATGGTEHCICIGDGTDEIFKSLTNSCTYQFTKAGTYYIYGWVRNESGTKYPDTVTLVVKDNTISVSGVSLNKTNATIDVGDTLNLTATVSPTNATNKTVTWTSSNLSVASVSNGAVTAKSAGTTTIIATTVDGSKTAACVVTVSAPEEPINPNAAAIVVNDITTRAGETFDVTVDVANNPGMCFLQVTLEYDKSVLTLKGASNGSVLSTFENGVNLQWSADADTSKNGTLVTLTFEVNENAESGDYTVNTIFREAYDSDLNDVDFTVAAGTITVADFIYGDANGDGEVTGKDAVLLRKYMVNYNYDTGTSSVAVSPGADANGDGEVTGKDAVLLRKYMVNYNYDTGTSSVVLGPQQ